MKNEKLFNETIDKLVKAYFEGTLKHGHCSFCAVGNIVGNGKWGDMFRTVDTSALAPNRKFIIRTNGVKTQVLDQMYYERKIDIPSEYSEQELMDIEWAFETAPKEGDWEFNGLMAVVDVLEKIHECDKETTELTKKRFVKA